MGMKEEIRPVTYLKSRAADLLDQINKTRRPLVITQKGSPRAVMLDPESYESLRSAVTMLKLVAMGEADVRAGRLVPQKKAFDAVRKRLRELRRRS